MIDFKIFLLVCPTLFLLSCNDSEHKAEEEAQRSLKAFYQSVVDTQVLDSSKLYFYSYPCLNQKIEIYLNDHKEFAAQATCTNIPGCLMFSADKHGEETTIKIVLDKKDTTFKIKNNIINKLLFGGDKSMTVYSDLDKMAWTVEY